MIIGGNSNLSSLSGLLSGAGFGSSSSSGTASGSDGLSGQIGSFATAAAGATGSSALGTAAAAFGSGAALGGTIGSVVPGIGTAIGAVAGGLIAGIGSLFSSKGGAPDHERGDLNTIAAANDITADQASWVCGYEQDHSPENYDDICAHAARDKAYFQQLVVKYNASGTSTPVRSQTAVAVEAAGPKYLALQQQAANMFAGTGTASPLANLSFSGAQAAAAQQQMSVSDYLTAILNGALAGAQQGAAGAAAGTPAGQAATNDTLAYLAKKYELALVAAGLGLAWLAKEAYENNSK